MKGFCEYNVYLGGRIIGTFWAESFAIALESAGKDAIRFGYDSYKDGKEAGHHPFFSLHMVGHAITLDMRWNDNLRTYVPA